MLFFLLIMSRKKSAQLSWSRFFYNLGASVYPSRYWAIPVSSDCVLQLVNNTCCKYLVLSVVRSVCWQCLSISVRSNKCCVCSSLSIVRTNTGSSHREAFKRCHTLKEITSQTDKYLVSLSSKTYVFEDKMTKYIVSLTSYFFLCTVKHQLL